MNIVVMGVSGSGKTTIGRLLSGQLNVPFFDADDFHPEENIAKMQSGIPLNDRDRMPWLEKLSVLLQEQKAGCVLACSALKESHRKKLYGSSPVFWVFLKGTMEIIQSRLQVRPRHFMPVSLLQSQFDTLEEPDYALQVDIDQSCESIVNQILDNLPH